LSKKENRSRLKSIDDYNTFPYPPEEESKEQRAERKRWQSLTAEQKEAERKALSKEIDQLYERFYKSIGEKPRGRRRQNWDILNFD
jgi:hypothetical protein